MRMSSIMRRRNGLMRVDESMALLLSCCEADCLVPQHKQNRSLSYSPPPSAAPYRASGLVLRPEAEVAIAKKRTPKLN